MKKPEITIATKFENQSGHLFESSNVPLLEVLTRDDLSAFQVGQHLTGNNHKRYLLVDCKYLTGGYVKVSLLPLQEA